MKFLAPTAHKKRAHLNEADASGLDSGNYHAAKFAATTSQFTTLQKAAM
jgi:hypothetical protein